MNFFQKTRWGKITSVILVVALMGGLWLGQPKKSEALFGLGDVVIDPAHIAETIAGWAADAGRWLVEHAFIGVLEAMKKRILDRLVDQIVLWIQGGGEPQFITNFSGFLEDAAQAAVGDVIEKSAYAPICDNSLRFQIQLYLTRVQTRFDSAVTCTLNDVLTNANTTIENFKESFQNGSWLAYQEVLLPQNNLYGLKILTNDQVVQEQAKRASVAQSEITAGQGFLSEKRCLAWSGQFVTGAPDQIGSKIETRVGDSLWENDYYKNAPTNIQGTGRWVCSQEETVTPGKLAGDTVSKAVGSDIDYIVNSQDLSRYIAAIVDAAVFRLSTEGLGLLGLYTGNYSNNYGSPPRQDNPSVNCEIFRNSDGTASATYNDCLLYQNSSSQYNETLITNAIDSAKRSSRDTRDILNDAQSTNGNNLAFLEIAACQNIEIEIGGESVSLRDYSNTTQPILAAIQTGIEEKLTDLALNVEELAEWETRANQPNLTSEQLSQISIALANLTSAFSELSAQARNISITVNAEAETIDRYRLICFPPNPPGGPF